MLVNVTPEYQCSNFDKTLLIGEIIRLTTEDHFKYRMVEYVTLSVYGFNLRVKAERVAAIAIVKDMSDFTVDDWKTSKEKPIWVLGFDEWHRDVPIHPRNYYKVDGSIQSLPNKKPEVLDIGETGKSENEKELLDSNDSVNKTINDAHGVNVGEDNDNENPCANMKGNCGENRDDVVGWDNTELKGNDGEDQDDVAE